jgi:anti-sigma B factor antagonist
MADESVELTVRASVEVRGGLDAATGPLLIERVRRLCAGGLRELTIDLDGLEFIDSRGLGALIHCRRLVHRQGADLHLLCAGGPARHLLAASGLDSVFGLEER